MLPAEARGRAAGGFTSSLFLGQFLCPLVLITLARATGTLGDTFVWLAAASALIAAFLPMVATFYRQPVPSQLPANRT